jgi:N-glycosylase/DNA lyase
MKKKLQPLALEEIRSLHREKKQAIRKRLAEFAAVAPNDYFYECAYCLLTPQSSAENAAQAEKALRANDFQHTDFDPEPLLHRKEYYIRFHKTKAKHLQQLKRQFPEILSRLINGGSSPQLREWLVKNVKGLGWKEASHLLRNIGHRDLAILDRHILKNLVRAGVMKQLPKTLTAKRYLEIERKFSMFAKSIKIPMDELDLLFWSIGTGEILK